MINILVIGDSCLDIFAYGRVDRLAPAAPVPVFKAVHAVKSAGMAANVQQNIVALGMSCDLMTNANWKSVIKTRYVEDRSNHMLLRVDINDDTIARIDIEDLGDITGYDVVIISDYCKGFLLENDIEKISKMHPLVFLDTKKPIGSWASDISYIKINGYEYTKTKDTIDEDIRKKLIVTMGNQGCLFYDKEFPVEEVPVKDLSGAGDTFIAALAVKYVETKSIEESLQFANSCATKVVQKRGVTTV
jgi:D-beta-D-heptose 7-phosphate kinase/D-beta-D-heptose 1-phosphate adenosyltransferase